MSEPRARLFLITPPLQAAADIGPRLEAALSAGDVACVLLRLADLPERDAKHLVRELAPFIQDNGAALLLEDPRLAARVGADGVQVAEAGEAFASALDSLKPERIVGVGGLSSRDDAMRAGEEGADYLMFGEPQPGRASEAPSDTLERVGWWAEIFNVPCVGYAATLGEVESLAAAGADFVALGEAVWGDPRDPAAAVAEAEAAIERAHASRAGVGV